MWDYLKLLLTLLPGELNLDEAFKAFSEAEAKGGGLYVVIDAILANSAKVFPNALTRPIAVLALQAIERLHHGGTP